MCVAVVDGECEMETGKLFAIPVPIPVPLYRPVCARRPTAYFGRGMTMAPAKWSGEL